MVELSWVRYLIKLFGLQKLPLEYKYIYIYIYTRVFIETLNLEVFV